MGESVLERAERGQVSPRAANGPRQALNTTEAAGRAGTTAVGQSGESSHQIRALHGLRFLAAFCILFSHACGWLGNFKDYNGFDDFGDVVTVYGMPLFFVLSGFVIHYNYSRLFSTMRLPWAILEFLGARFARIYPLFVCFLLVGIATDQVLLWFYDHKLNLVLTLAHSFTLTQSWFYIVLFHDRLLIDGPYGMSWSLSTEFFFYLSYIVLVLHVSRARRISSLLITAGLVSTFAFVMMGLAAAHRHAISDFAEKYMSDRLNEKSTFIWWLFYYSPYCRVFEFILGCLTAQLYACLSDRKISTGEGQLGRYLLASSLLFLFGFALAFTFRPFGPAVASFMEILKLNFGCAVAIAVLIFCVSRYRDSTVALWLSTPLMVYLGDLSYSIYTVHTWTLRIFQRPDVTFRVGEGLEAIFRIALAITLTLVLSTATYRLIEVPARAWLRKRVAQRLVKVLGPRELNILSAGQAYSSHRAAALACAFAVMFGLLAVYQFLVVPHFTPYLD